MNTAAEARAAAALSTMQQNREQLLQAYAPQRDSGQFPRSATFRWLGSHLSGKAIISTLVSAAVFRPSWLRLLGAVLTSRRAGRRR